MQASIIALSLLLFAMSPTGVDDIRTPASFEGRVIDLARDWEGANACYADESGAWCFRSERELDKWLDENREESMFAVCGGTLRLYDKISFGSPLLTLGTSSSWINLGNYSFNNKTSSYRVGACSSIFADGANGGTPHYPSSLTVAYKQASSMASGWDNRVSSVLHS